MGQTLTHGVYLPDEGERNCYSGLAANWQILDTSVGTIAANTAALAGKAPLVHTHTVSQITDFPAYGNAAGTICEGNDSRLSDARTPVAHTHGKADITDLFNSANTWTQSQNLKNTEYQIGEIPSAVKASYINFTDKNNVNIGWIQRRLETRGDSSIELFVYNKFTNSHPDTAGTLDYAMLKVGLKSDQTHFCEITGDTYPRNNNVYNLGLSTNQWKTFNGINPGALSLPQRGSEAIILDVTAQGLNWDLTGATDITYTPTVDGWLQLRCKDTDGDFLFATWGQIRQSVFGRGLLAVLNEGLALTIPVRKDIAVSMRCKATANMVATVTPCLGNV